MDPIGQYIVWNDRAKVMRDQIGAESFDILMRQFGPSGPNRNSQFAASLAYMDMMSSPGDASTARYNENCSCYQDAQGRLVSNQELSSYVSATGATTYTRESIGTPFRFAYTEPSSPYFIKYDDEAGEALIYEWKESNVEDYNKHLMKGANIVSDALGATWGLASAGINSMYSTGGIPRELNNVFGTGSQRISRGLRSTLPAARKFVKGIGRAAYVLNAATYLAEISAPGSVSTATHVNFGITTLLLIGAATPAAPVVAVVAFFYGSAQVVSYLSTGKNIEEHIFD